MAKGGVIVVIFGARGMEVISYGPALTKRLPKITVMEQAKHPERGLLYQGSTLAEGLRAIQENIITELGENG